MSEYRGDPETLLEKLFEKAIKDAIKQSKKNGQEPNKLGVVISSEELNNDITVKSLLILHNYICIRYIYKKLCPILPLLYFIDLKLLPKVMTGNLCWVLPLW
jgi:hypothetical protein